MITTATVDLALGIANAAVKLGRRGDLIQVQHMLGDPLPIKLPPTAPNYGDLILEMKSFFQGAKGQDVLADDESLSETWEAYLEAIDAGNDNTIIDLGEVLVQRWVLIVGRSIPSIGDNVVPPPEPSQMIMIEYYMVDAAKPGHQRSAVIDIALATADVALEFVGGNPAIITKDPAVQKVLAIFLTHFTKGDLEDLSYRQLFERTLSSVIRTAIEERKLAEDVNGLALFLESLAQVHEADPDFVAGLVAGKGFDKLMQSLLTTIGDNLARFTDEQAVVDIVGGILKDVSSDAVFAKILKGDEDAMATVAQIAIGHIATHPVLLDKVQGEEIWHAVLHKVLEQVGTSAKKQKLFSEEALGALVNATLQGVAHNKELFEGDFIERLVASVADTLSATPLNKLLGEGNLRLIAAAVLDASAENTDLLIKNDKLLSAVLSAVMAEGAKGFGQGFDSEFATELAIAAIDAVGANASSIDLPEPFGKIVGTILKELSRKELRKHLVARDIVSIFTDAVQILAANPHLWERFAGGKLPASVLRSIARVVADDPTKLLRGPVLSSLIVEVLEAVSRRAEAYARVVSGQNPLMTKLLEETLKRLQNEVGVKLGADNVVAVIVRLVLDWGQDKFLVDAEDAAFKNRVGTALLAVA